MQQPNHDLLDGHVPQTTCFPTNSFPEEEKIPRDPNADSLEMRIEIGAVPLPIPQRLAGPHQ